MEKTHHDLMLPEELAAECLPAGWQDLHVLVGVSGGADSMALLRVLLKLKSLIGGQGEVSAVHVNHRLRGEESEADAGWLRETCQQLSVPLVVKECDVKQVAALQGDGVESAAREQRYRLFTETAEQRGARYVAIAHQREDQVETVLFRLFRGTGLRGLAGMPFSRPLSESVALLRPLLDCPRSALVAYLEEIGQGYRIDPSNQDYAYARNRLRGELLPLVREHFNPEADAAILRTIEQANWANEALQVRTHELLEASLEEVAAKEIADSVCLALGLKSLCGEHEYLVSEVLRAAWRQAGLSEQAMTQQCWHRLADLALGRIGQTITLPGNLLASCHEDMVVIRADGRDSLRESCGKTRLAERVATNMMRSESRP